QITCIQVDERLVPFGRETRCNAWRTEQVKRLDAGRAGAAHDFIEPLKPAPSFAERAYPVLREAVLRLDLRPGARVSENQLADKFGISRSPIRQTLTLLQSEGLVVTVPQKGTY